MTHTMPEPPDRALVGLFAPVDDNNYPEVFRRDDEQSENYEGDEPIWFGEPGEFSWSEVLQFAAKSGLDVVRLYRADDPAITVNEAVQP